MGKKRKKAPRKEQQGTIVVTGGAGFIGSALVAHLNSLGTDEIVVVDALGSDDRWKNLRSLRYRDFVHKDLFRQMISSGKLPWRLRAVVHMGACSSTTERNADYLIDNNVNYSKEVALFCVKKGVRFVYASSAATYGAGEQGYQDDETTLELLRPLNMYGYSKQLFDLWAKREGLLKKITGLKFFNVYGPNEYHKADMRSMVLKSFEQIQQWGKVRLFKSYDEGFRDGEQMRDFIYIKDCVQIISWLLENPRVTGIYNVGSGKARTWNDLVSAVFSAVGMPVHIEMIEMPESLRNQYQYFTEAPMVKLLSLNPKISRFSLEEGVRDYVTGYLLGGPHFMEG